MLPKLPLPDPVRQALQQLAQQSDCLIFGETHGTQEVPQLLASLLDDLTALGYGGLGLEMPFGEQEAFRRWATGASRTLPRFFTWSPSDGRANEQSLALIRQVADNGWQLLCFDAHDDQARATWTERDSTMADNLTALRRQCCPDRKVVGVCGNLHSRLAPHTAFPDLWPSFAACLQQRNPQHVVHTVDVVFHEGSFFNGGVKTLLTNPLAEAEVREAADRGHSLELHLPRATPPTFLQSQTG
jgi:hypothetical protein